MQTRKWSGCARENPAANLSFRVCSQRLESVLQTFDVILDRHAPFDLAAIAAHLRPGRSLVFWPNAIDPAHADVNGQSALASAAILNQVLAGNLDERGFVTNEHRYLAIAPSARERDRG